MVFIAGAALLLWLVASAVFLVLVFAEAAKTFSKKSEPEKHPHQARRARPMPRRRGQYGYQRRTK